MQKKFLTITEAADYLKVSKTSLRRWTNNGRLACYRVGHRNERRFLLDDLVAFMGESVETDVQRDAGQVTVSDSPRPVDHVHQDTRRHICTFYRSPKEQWRLLRAHLLTHLSSDARSVYIYQRDKQQLLSWLASENLDPEELISRGVLELYTYADTYLKDGYFSTDRMLTFWQDIIARKKASGVKRLFLSGEMGWASSGILGCEQLVPYEAALDAMLEVTPWVTVVCQYPVYQFSGSTVYDNLCIHTHVQLPDRLETGFGPAATS
ncbi:MAG: MEDS domain-containing protein [Gammaproteobacteria bacterium]|nr:MEDS domain-containing protein [Gammaproteobacteria bacterium]MDE0513721.1 MEDS domain-containing protein [Gammaproteobacteria bacterium]